MLVLGKRGKRWGIHHFLGVHRVTPYICNGWDVCMNGTTRVPRSVLRYVVDKVKLNLSMEYLRNW